MKPSQQRSTSTSLERLMSKLDQVEVVETLNTIISIQSGVINELFLLLSQYVAMEELENIAVVERINTAARLRQDLE